MFVDGGDESENAANPVSVYVFDRDAGAAPM